MGIAFSNGEGKEAAVRRYSPLSGILVQAYTLDRFRHYIIRNHATWERIFCEKVQRNAHLSASRHGMKGVASP